MKLSKKLVQNSSSRAALAWLASSYIRLVIATNRMDVEVDVLTQTAGAHEGTIVAFWHARLMMMASAWKADPARFRMMISNHRDGLLISRIIRHFDIQTQPIDAKSGGLRAMRSMKRYLDGGYSVGITPDGPRGPRREVKAGVVTLARMSGKPIVPLSYNATRRKVFNSWDRFVFPLPFGRLVMRAGEPIVVPRNADAAEMERLRQLLETRLSELDDLVDQACGHARDSYRPLQPSIAGTAASAPIEDAADDPRNDTPGGAA